VYITLKSTVLFHKIKEKLENNERIIKKFKFDLEMGIFKIGTLFLSNGNYHEIFQFYGIDNSKFTKVLDKAGFKCILVGPVIYTEEEGISINRETREYWKIYYSVRSFSEDKNANLIPSYVFEYSKCPLLDVMKETLHDIFKRNKDK